MVSICMKLLVFVISFHLLIVVTIARFHYHPHKKHKHSHPISQISLPPAPAPGLSPASQSPDAEYPYNSTTTVFNVRKFGAVGDGVTDDTVPVKTAWDAACQVESGVLLLPYGYSFMIQSTIFTGPCQGGLIFQVIDVVFCSQHT